MQTRNKAVRRYSWLSALLLATVMGTVTAAQPFQGGTHLKEDPVQVQAWNAFVDGLYALHKSGLEGRQIRTEERLGGYGGPFSEPDFYHEVRYFDAESGRLLSWVQRERKNPEAIHAIQVNEYDRDGVLVRDYYAGYLERFRNAPIHTFINLHASHGELEAFRQFDASGRRLFERCTGRYAGQPVRIEVENFRPPPPVVDSPAYAACFRAVPARAAEFLDPLVARSE